VVVVEKRPTPRHKACGDALTPRALRELSRLGLDPFALGAHRLDGVRMVHGRREIEVAWPRHDDLADHAAVLRRDLLDTELRRIAATAGAEVVMGHEAVAPIVERGFVRGATLLVDPGATRGLHSVRARFVVVADGANSSFGRAVGTARQRSWPYGITTRTYFASPRTADTWMETALGLPDAAGRPASGYGWVIPLGDGTVNVGVGMLSTYRDVRGMNALKLLHSFAEQIAERWQLDPTRSLKAPTRFRLPLGGSVAPKQGPTFLVAGDAAGMANPFNGDGVDAALMSGRIAAGVLDEALRSNNSAALQRYPTALAADLGPFHRVGRLHARLLGRPMLLRPALRLGMRSDRFMGGVLRIAANELRDQHGGAERAYALATTLAKLAPGW
jgi:menaquinone-9 beta-reductase